MKTAYIVSIVVIILSVGIGAYSLRPNITGNFVQSNTQSQNTQSTCTKLSDMPYAQYTYLISSDQLSPNAQAALSGFQMTKTQLSNGDTSIKLTTSNTKYFDQSYTLRPEDSLYFVEMSFGDDGFQQDNSLGDDTAVVVDSNDCVIQ